MAATNTVTLYAVIVALLCFALAFIVIWSRRELRMRLIALVLAFSTAPVVYFAFTQLPGKPSALTVEEFRANYRCATIIPIGIKQGVEILMVAKKEHERHPEYLSVEWNMSLASSLQKSMRVAKLNGKGSIIYAAKSCNEDGEGEGDGKGGKGKKGKKGKGGAGKPGAGQRGQGLQQPGSSGQEQSDADGFNFYPDPVPPMPEKNYGPLYEGPIELPSR